MRWYMKKIIIVFILFLCGIIGVFYSCNSKDVTITNAESPMTEVDLGLSVKWSNMNLGASKPEEFGRYYVLGDVQPHDSIYDFQLPSGEWYDSLGVVYLQYDAAYYHTNKKWRIPTLDEWEELGAKCKWRWVTYNGVEGYRVEGPNGNSIFLPAAGSTESKYGDPLEGFYRSSCIWDGGASFSVFFSKPQSMKSPQITLGEDKKGDVCEGSTGCHVPASVRPVKAK